MREQRVALEKELGSMQAKAQGTYQELQTMQIKVKACIWIIIVQLAPAVSCFITLELQKSGILKRNVQKTELLKAECRCLCAVSAGEGAAGRPDHSTAAGERHPEGRSQLRHQPDGEQVSVTQLFTLPRAPCMAPAQLSETFIVVETISLSNLIVILASLSLNSLSCL